MQGKIFISYRRASNAWAVEKLRQELTGAFGEKNIFLDTQTIAGGDDWSVRIDEAVRTASVVIVVFCKEWFGAQDVKQGDQQQPSNAQRRIDDPNDKLRIEVELADRYKRCVMPVIIDDSPEPRKDELPEGLDFLCDLQFRRIDVKGNAEKQMQRMLGDIRSQTAGHNWLWRLAGQSVWLGLIAFALVVALHAMGAFEVYKHGFARAALMVRDQIEPVAPDLAVADMSEAELRELFGARTPLDPELFSIVLNRLGTDKSHCGFKRPIVLNLDIAPTGEADEQGHQSKLTDALVGLAKCRPLVLACPAAVRRAGHALNEMRWMDDLLSKAAPNSIVFAGRTADPEGLRRLKGRSEMGVVAADLAAGRPVFEGHSNPKCVCPRNPALANECAGNPIESEWDARAFAVPLPGSSHRRVAETRSLAALSGALASAKTGIRNSTAVEDQDDSYYTFSEALRQADVFTRSRALLIGTNRSQARYAVPGRPRRAFEGVSSTVVQAHLLHSAMDHEPRRGNPFIVLCALLAGCIVAVMMLLGGLELERNDQRFAQRWRAYLLMALGLVAVPLIALRVAAQWPSEIWWLSLVTLVAIVSAARSLLSCFEIVLNRGLDWRWPSTLWRELLHANAKSSAMLRLVIFTIEGMVIGGCLTLAWVLHGNA